MKEVSASSEDYLEAIYQICEQSQVARVKEIAHQLKVSTASVVGALRLLRKKGLVEQEWYGYIRLTEEGVRLAKEVSQKHSVLSDFFHQVLGLELKKADQEACKAEHSLAPETVEKIVLLQQFLTEKLKGKSPLLEGFYKFSKQRSKKK